MCAVLVLSCDEDSKKREALRIKTQEKTEAVFKTVDQHWKFKQNMLSPKVQAAVNDWKEWRDFNTELKQKPKSTIGAFRKKAGVLADHAAKLNNNIPEKFANAQIKSRIAILTTQLQSLDLYINLQNIPTEKVVSLISEINTGIKSLELQFEEIIRKEAIPMEEGEADMIRLLDTTRAIKSTPIK